MLSSPSTSSSIILLITVIIIIINIASAQQVATQQPAPTVPDYTSTRPLKCGDVIQDVQQPTAFLKFDTTTTSTDDADYTSCKIIIGPRVTFQRLLIEETAKIFQLTISGPDTHFLNGARISGKFNDSLLASTTSNLDERSYIRLVNDVEFSLLDSDQTTAALEITVSSQLTNSNDFSYPEDHEIANRGSPVSSVAQILIENCIFDRPGPTQSRDGSHSVMVRALRITEDFTMRNNEIIGVDYALMFQTAYFFPYLGNKNDRAERRLLLDNNRIHKRQVTPNSKRSTILFRGLFFQFQKFIVSNNDIVFVSAIYNPTLFDIKQCLFAGGAEVEIKNNKFILDGPIGGIALGNYGSSTFILVLSQLLGYDKNPDNLKSMTVTNNTVISLRSGAMGISLDTCGYFGDLIVQNNNINMTGEGKDGVYSGGVSFSSIVATDMDDNPANDKREPRELVLIRNHSMFNVKGSIVVANNKISVAVFSNALAGKFGSVSGITGDSFVDIGGDILFEYNDLTVTSDDDWNIVNAISSRPTVGAVFARVGGAASVSHNHVVFRGAAIFGAAMGLGSLANITNNQLYFNNTIIMEPKFKLKLKFSFILVNDSFVQTIADRNTVVAENIIMTQAESDGLLFFNAFNQLHGQNAQYLLTNNVFNVSYDITSPASTMNRLAFFENVAAVADIRAYTGNALPPDVVLFLLFLPGFIAIDPNAAIPLATGSIDVRIEGKNVMNVRHSPFALVCLTRISRWRSDIGDLNSGLKSKVVLDGFKLNIDRNEENIVQEQTSSSTSPAISRKYLIRVDVGYLPQVTIKNSKFHFLDASVNNDNEPVARTSFASLSCQSVETSQCVTGGFFFENNILTFNELSSPSSSSSLNGFMLFSSQFDGTEVVASTNDEIPLWRLGSRLVYARNQLNFIQPQSGQRVSSASAPNGFCGIVGQLVRGKQHQQQQANDGEHAAIVNVSENIVSISTNFRCAHSSLLSIDADLLGLEGVEVVMSGNKIQKSSSSTSSTSFSLMNVFYSSVSSCSASSPCWNPSNNNNNNNNDNNIITFAHNTIDCVADTNDNDRCHLLYSGSKNLVPSSSSKTLQIKSNTFRREASSSRLSSSILSSLEFTKSAVSNQFPLHLPSSTWKIDISASSPVSLDCNKFIEKKILDEFFFETTTTKLSTSLADEIFEASSRQNEIISTDCEIADIVKSLEPRPTNKSSNNTDRTPTKTPEIKKEEPKESFSPQLAQAIDGSQGFAMGASFLSSISTPALGFSVPRKQATLGAIAGLRRGSCQGLPEPVPSPLSAADSPTQLVIPIDDDAFEKEGINDGRWIVGGVVGNLILAYSFVFGCEVLGMLYFNHQQQKGNIIGKKDHHHHHHRNNKKSLPSFFMIVFAKCHVTTIVFVVASLFFAPILNLSFVLTAASSPVPVSTRAILMVAAIVLVLLPVSYFNYWCLFKRKRIERARNQQQHYQLKEKMTKKKTNNSKKEESGENTTTTSWLKTALLQKFNYLFGVESEWQIPLKSTSDEELSFLIAVPLIEGYRDTAPWFSVAEFMCQFGIAISSLIAELVSAEVSCVSLVVSLCVVLGVFGLACLYWMPFQERFLRVMMPLMTFFDVIIVAVAAAFKENPPAWLDALIAVSLSLQSAISVLALVMSLAPLLNPISRAIMRMMHRRGKNSNNTNNLKQNRHSHGRRLDSLVDEENDIEFELLRKRDREISQKLSKREQEQKDRQRHRAEANKRSPTSRSSPRDPSAQKRSQGGNSSSSSSRPVGNERDRRRTNHHSTSSNKNDNYSAERRREYQSSSSPRDSSSLSSRDRRAENIDERRTTSDRRRTSNPGDRHQRRTEESRSRSRNAEDYEQRRSQHHGSHHHHHSRSRTARNYEDI